MQNSLLLQSLLLLLLAYLMSNETFVLFCIPYFTVYVPNNPPISYSCKQLVSVEGYICNLS